MVELGTNSMSGMQHNNRIINTATGRSGTMALALLGQLLEFPSHHQHTSYAGKEGDCIPFDLNNWPTKVDKYLKKVAAKLPQGDYFNSDWGVGWIMYPMHKTWPDIKWMITVRNPQDTANSLRRIRWKHEAERIDVNYYGMFWHSYYSWILKQVMEMNPRPYYVDFDKLVSGEYDAAIYKLFGFDITDSLSLNRLQKMRRHWTQKHNATRGIYPVHDLMPSLVKQCEELKTQLMVECKTLRGET